MRRVDLAAMPGGPHLIPSRTQSLSPPGPMVLCLKAWESRSLPGLHGACEASPRTLNHNGGFGRDVLGRGLFAAVCVSGAKFDAGWSSPVARQAHNLKVVGSNPTPAPKFKGLAGNGEAFLLAWRAGDLQVRDACSRSNARS